MHRWGGEQTFFSGEIVSYDDVNDRYKVVYDDGDADEALEFRNYEVSHKAGKVDIVKVLETDQDDVEGVPGEVLQAAVAKGEW